LTLLDAYPLVALIADEPAAAEVEGLLKADGAQVPVVNLCEVLDVCQRTHAVPEREIRSVIEPLLLAGRLTAVTSGMTEAWIAADVRARYYDRKACALSLADCLLLAHATTAVEGIATADPAVAEVARAEGLAVISLPDSTGARP